ncbi:MAG TPA: hypothetical protein VMB27_25935, partial [Solirubrobacteraceae bacterium]|nr:hypothetical protein [Solirubrobacteraceae bacterium]
MTMLLLSISPTRAHTLGSRYSARRADAATLTIRLWLAKRLTCMTTARSTNDSLPSFFTNGDPATMALEDRRPGGAVLL